MPVLKYRDPVDGTFKKLSGGTSGGTGADEVVIGSGAPTDAAIELWVDLDDDTGTGGGGGGGGTTTIDGMPIGAILPYPSVTPPTDWLLCDGAAIPAEYTDLIALVGANTPNLLGKFVAGAGAGSYAVGATGGSDAHVLTVGEMPSHSHAGATQSMNRNGTHGHGISTANPQYQGFTLPTGSYGTFGVNGPAPGYVDATDTNHEHNIWPEGSGYAHENRPPFHALAYIIKAVPSSASSGGGGGAVGPKMWAGSASTGLDGTFDIPMTGATFTTTPIIMMTIAHSGLDGLVTVDSTLSSATRAAGRVIYYTAGQWGEGGPGWPVNIFAIEAGASLASVAGPQAGSQEESKADANEMVELLYDALMSMPSGKKALAAVLAARKA